MAENKIVPFLHPIEDSLAVPPSRIPGHIFFETERHVVFSPLEQGVSFENIILLVIIAKLSKTPEGQKILKDLTIKYLDSCTKIVESVHDSSVGANALTAISNLNLSAAMAHRLGLIDDGGYIRICDHCTTVTNALINISVLQNVAGPVTTLVTGSKYGVGGKEGVSMEGLGALAATLKGLL